MEVQSIRDGTIPMSSITLGSAPYATFTYHWGVSDVYTCIENVGDFADNTLGSMMSTIQMAEEYVANGMGASAPSIQAGSILIDTLFEGNQTPPVRNEANILIGAFDVSSGLVDRSNANGSEAIAFVDAQSLIAGTDNATALDTAFNIDGPPPRPPQLAPPMSSVAQALTWVIGQERLARPGNYQGTFYFIEK